MTNQEILYKWYSPSVESIFGYMYGSPSEANHEIIEISKKKIDLGVNADCLIFTWGWPGPDVNFYYFKDYGKTWAFSREEIKDV